MTDKKDAPRSDAGKKTKKLNKEEELKLKAAENLAGWQKALADYQNLEKEMEKRLASMADFTSNAFILELLPIFDNYQTAINHIPEEQRQESWAVGLEHILKMWQSFLEEHNVEVIQTLGQEFNPHWHESVGEVNDEQQEDQVIVEEKLTGYRMKDNVIRPAKVIINNIK